MYDIGTDLGAIDENDAVRVEGHSREELQQLLQRVSVGLRKEEAEVAKGVPSLGRAGELWRGEGRGEG